ncbi:MAG TPA: hypothetical protein VN641_01790 [Urbifossiella sp.]|nr:hypothetical protein [Urbifossiella sp.]
MPAAKWTIGTVLLLAGAVQLSARPDEAVDLRGPAPKKGDISVSKSVFRIKGADVKIAIGGAKINAKQSLTATEEEETKVLAVEGRQATKVQTRMIKEQVESKTELGGQEKDDSKAGELDKEVIISQRDKNGKWKHSLVDTKPTAKQKRELDKRVGPENQDELYPEGKVKVGHTWTVDASALQRVFGGSITELKGKLKMKFVKIETIDGEECAVIEMAGDIKGVAKETEGTLDVELKNMTGTTWRSIKTGVDVKDKAKGDITMSGKIEMDGAKADLMLEGPFTIDSTAKQK